MDLLAAAEQLISAAATGGEQLDLYLAATSLEQRFPEFTRCEVARVIAEAAVLAGCRSFAWDPAETGCPSPRCTCRGGPPIHPA